MKLLTTTLAVLLIAISVSAQSGEVKTEEVKRIHCTVQSNHVLNCFDEKTETHFPLVIGRRHVWAKHLEDLPEGATMEFEGTGNRVCLVQVNIQNGWVRNPANQRYPCISVKRKGKARR